MDRIIRIDEVVILTTLLRSTIYRNVKKGDFPPPAIKLKKKSRGWRMSVIEKFLNNGYINSKEE